MFTGKLNELEDRAECDGREVDEVKWIDSKAALKLIREGEITDGPTITALLLFRDFLVKKESDTC